MHRYECLYHMLLIVKVITLTSSFLPRSCHSFSLRPPTETYSYHHHPTKQYRHASSIIIHNQPLLFLSRNGRNNNSSISKLYQKLEPEVDPSSSSPTITTSDTSTDTDTDMDINTMSNTSSQRQDIFQNLSRRDTFLLLIGGTAYAKLASTVFQKIQRGEDVYPPEHETRVMETFDLALTTSASTIINRYQNKDEKELLLSSSSSSSSSSLSFPRPLRVLEIGIGSSCRTFRRGMYDDAIRHVFDITNNIPQQQKQQGQIVINGIDFLGVDIDIPKSETTIVQNARDHIDSVLKTRSKSDEKGEGGSNSFPMTFNVQLGDITKGLPFPDGYFDVITTSLVLCSVQDQKQALKEIQRLLNPKGGSYGYIEHVAVNTENEQEKDLGFLEWQQQTLDPLQQTVAHNCHLHRYTDSIIYDLFVGNRHGNSDGNTAQLVQSERFQVKDMWPVSCQSRGVVQFS